MKEKQQTVPYRMLRYFDLVTPLIVSIKNQNQTRPDWHKTEYKQATYQKYVLYFK